MKKQLIDEDRLEIFLEMKRGFQREIMPKTRQAIKELITETDQGFQKECRIEYLKERMSDLIVETWELIGRYEDYQKRERTIERLLTGEKIQGTTKDITKLQGEIIFLKKGNKTNKTGVTPEMVERAKAYPFESLIEVNRNHMALCPFHGDKRPSMKYYPENNTLFCFGCQWRGDTIAFVMQQHGMGFSQAIKYLN